MQVVTKQHTDKLKECEEGKRKHYRCVCHLQGGAVVTADELRKCLDGNTAAGQALTVAQQTPLRVLHRRTGMTRDKVIYAIRTEWISPKIFLLDLTTSAGTYVKEFVHGDFGRTLPNVGTLLLGKPTDILQLDVTGIEYE